MSITEETRREAYIAIQPKITPMERAVLLVLSRRRNATVEEIMVARRTKNPNNVAPRMTALVGKGLVKTSGRRPNKHGHNMAVYELTYDGMVAVDDLLAMEVEQ